MIKTLLTAAAIAFSITAAHADSLPLTDPLVGHWCKVEAGVYKRGTWSCSGNFLVTQEGYTDYAADDQRDMSTGGDGDCWFADVRRLPSRDGYAITTKCGPKEETREVELRIIRGMLHYRESSGGCSRVGEGMSDGFLNLRAGPGTQYAVKARLVTGDVLRVDDRPTAKGWTRVSVPRFRANNKDFTGWVSGKFIVDSSLSCHTP